MTSWLLFDYGEVLCLPPSAEDRRQLAEAAEQNEANLWRRYWEVRPAYDRGELTTLEYWHTVTGATSSEQIATLHELDVAMWSRPNQPVLAHATRARERGLSLAILSNAPSPLADAFDRLTWLAGFSPRLFSGRLGLLKPEPAIFLLALDALAAAAAEVLFIDDRPENVATANSLGLRGVLCEGVASIEAALAWETGQS